MLGNSGAAEPTLAFVAQSSSQIEFELPCHQASRAYPAIHAIAWNYNYLYGHTHGLGAHGAEIFHSMSAASSPLEKAQMYLLGLRTMHSDIHPRLGRVALSKNEFLCSILGAFV